MIINGKREKSARSFSVINPFTGKKVGSAQIASFEQIDRAMRLSYKAETRLTVNERANILNKAADGLNKNKNEFARLIIDESGLSLKDALHEVDRAVEVARVSSIVAKNINKETTDDYVFHKRSVKPALRVITEPLDLVVGITPFNHPLNQVAHKVFPAIAAGAAMVLKPSEKTPLSAIKLGELLLELGLEKNMLNIVTGLPPKKIVDQMVSSPLMDVLTFTGGLEVGLSIIKKMVTSGNVLKKSVLELGGCSSLIIHEDADIVNAVKVAMSGCFKNSGQRCTAIRRVIVLESIADEFVDMITGSTKKIKYGNPYDINTDMGTVISEEAARIIQRRVSDSIREGAVLKTGNIRKGALYSPTVLDKVNIKSYLTAKETFGPVCAIFRVKNIDQAVKLANQTNYGLAGAVMTENRKIAEQVFNSLKVGQFSWNGIPSYRSEAAPFGGFKDSGNGEKEGVVCAAKGMRRIKVFYRH